MPNQRKSIVAGKTGDGSNKKNSIVQGKTGDVSSKKKSIASGKTGDVPNKKNSIASENNGNVASKKKSIVPEKTGDVSGKKKSIVPGMLSDVPQQSPLLSEKSESLPGTVEGSDSSQSYNPSNAVDDDNDASSDSDSTVCNACTHLAKGSITQYMISEKFLENNPEKLEGFNLFDTYCEGYIKASDLENALIAVGYFVTPDELKTVCEHLNIQPSSHLDFRLFMSVLAHQMVDRSEAQIKGAFRIFDKEGRGTIDSRELKHIMTVLGVQTDEEQIDDMIREVDVDGDGDIDFQEFVMMIKK